MNEAWLEDLGSENPSSDPKEKTIPYRKLQLLPKLEKIFVKLAFPLFSVFFFFGPSPLLFPYIIFSRKEVLNQLRKDDFLATCMKWLLPYKKGELPNIKIRTMILKVLTQVGQKFP